MMDALETEKVQKFISDTPLPKYGLDPPNVEVILKAQNAILADLVFGTPVSNQEQKGKDLCYVKNKTRNEIYLVNSKILEPFIVSKPELLQSK